MMLACPRWIGTCDDDGRVAEPLGSTSTFQATVTGTFHFIACHVIWRKAKMFCVLLVIPIQERENKTNRVAKGDMI
jgi:hypothetical protein